MPYIESFHSCCRNRQTDMPKSNSGLLIYVTCLFVYIRKHLDYYRTKGCLRIFCILYGAVTFSVTAKTQ